MTILIAPDKFKGSLTAIQVCEAVKRGLLATDPTLDITSLPLADGGEGTSELLARHTGGKMVKVNVLDPLFREITSAYGLSRDGKTAFIEMAKASGLQLLKVHERNPLHTTSYGTGQLIADALARGATQIVLCIGGSATNDAGLGMAEALGYEFFDSIGDRLRPTGESLVNLHSIKTDHVVPLIKNASFLALCDVDNPLYGDHGAAFVYAPQKGANPGAVKALDQGLRNFEQVIRRTFHREVNFAGAGAGGGIPAGGFAFVDMTVNHGMDYITAAVGLEEKVRKADLIITGEGKIDRQTLSGKVVMAVAKAAVRHHKPVTAVCGSSDLTVEATRSLGISTVISLTDEFTPIDEAVRRAGSLLEQRIIQAFGSRSARP